MTTLARTPHYYFRLKMVEVAALGQTLLSLCVFALNGEEADAEWQVLSIVVVNSFHFHFHVLSRRCCDVLFPTIYDQTLTSLPITFASSSIA